MGHTKICGCLKIAIKHDLTRQRFGRLVVEEFAYRKKTRLIGNASATVGKSVLSALPIFSVDSLSHVDAETWRTRRLLPRTCDRGLLDGTMLLAIDGNRKMNKSKHSGHVGVHYDKPKKKWLAQIMLQRKRIFLGRYDTIEEAIEARKAAEDKYFGKYRNKE